MRIIPLSDTALAFGKKWADHARLSGTSGEKAIIDGIYTVICRYTPVKTTLIALKNISVICHPRSGKVVNLKYKRHYVDALNMVNSDSIPVAGVIGGWKDGTDLLTSEYIFPLVDEDNASFIFTDADPINGEFVQDTGNYGNLYWTNGEDVLSWKGTPTRHFRLPSDTELPGLSTIETGRDVQGETLFEYTSFGFNVYQNGEVYLTAPKYSWPKKADGNPEGRCLVLGAMLDDEGNTLIVTQSDRALAPVGAKGGYYLMVWKESSAEGSVDGWLQIFEQQYTRNGLPWFGNKTGTEFVCGNGDKIIISSTTTLTLAIPSEGTYNETGTGHITFNAKYNSAKFYEFIDNIIINSPVSMTFNASSSNASTADKYANTTLTIPIVVETPDTPTPLTVVGPPDVDGNMPEYTGNLADYNPSGGSISGGTVSKEAPTGCGTGQVTITVTCADGSGSETASLDVRISGGSWSVDSDIIYSDGGLGTYVVNTNGTTRVEEWIGYGCRIRSSVTSSTEDCVYFAGLGYCSPSTRATGYTCDGPQFSLVAPAALQASIDESRATCVTTYGDVPVCNVDTQNECGGRGWNGEYTSVASVDQFCSPVYRRRISTYTC